jgi:hypothetical protein
MMMQLQPFVSLMILHLAAGLVGQAYEDSFNQEDREIKRGGNAKDTRGAKKADVIKKSKLPEITS